MAGNKKDFKNLVCKGIDRVAEQLIVTPTTEGNLSVGIIGGTVQDLAGKNTPATQLTRTVDFINPITFGSDFNSDGQSDILWRNQATGENVIWQMHGKSLTQGTFIAPASDLNWQVG